MIAEYLEHALQFERLASLEENPKLKADLQKQAALTASWRQNAPKSSAWSRPKFQTPKFQTKITQNPFSGVAPLQPASWPCAADTRHQLSRTLILL
jgi:hypothetical protein